MKKRVLSLAAAAALLLAACSVQGVTPLYPQKSGFLSAAAQDEALDEAVGDFGLELLRQVRTEGENTLLSPLSILYCLSMCANGAAGDTLGEFESLLAGGGTVDALNENCRSLLETYRTLEDGDSGLAELYGITPRESTLHIANSLWLDSRAQVEDAFLGRCTETYEAMIFAADFTRDRTRQELNRWIKDRTGGHIQEALKELDPETVLALVNAVYFQGKWADPFDPDDTRNGQAFYPESGETAQVDLMGSGGRTDLFIGTEREQGVLLPYRDGRLAFLALLPGQGLSLTEYLDGLTGESLWSLISGAEERHFILRLPKFTAYWQGGLTEALRAAGLELAFTPDQADFSPMGTGENGAPLYLSAVEHGAGVEVDEQGTRAFSFTFGAMNAGGAAPPEELRFDRPFVYGIVDLKRGIPLFLGTFEQP